ncbi:heme exporter protein C [Thioclava sp. ES.031]|uniref:heme ABC transporter permease n=1 Tax=unclassified Thioclava TaxID=2621713 RepID=UPI000BF9CFF2|nr:MULTISPECIES: heme ABC transporter permease [unclassified Thioclava]MPQ93767.1 heme ABC transporter permease [Thioclava sp. JE_KL1]PFG63290.1 heme exporter protein C [Thioclava sp. ES.031]
MSIWEYANPVKFMKTTDKILPWTVGIAAITLIVGLVWGYFFVPAAENFGGSVKVIYVHVPAAMMAINIWVMMVVTSLIWLIRRHHVSALAAKAAAPIGAVMTLIALITGAVWGQPMWGTWWEWDPRLTSFLILFLFYLGYIALWAAVENPDTAADLTGVLSLVGGVFAVLSRYAANFWNQGLHQGATLSMDSEQHIADVYWFPLLLCLAGFVFFFLALVLIRTRTEVRARRLGAIQQRERMA